MKTITVIGKRWFQKTYGNTYFSAVGMIDGEVVVTIPFEYGYDGMYLQRTTEEMVKMGLLPGIKKYEHGGHEALWCYCSDKDIKLNYSAADVARKKDL
jgi:predicted phosphohydrolase